MVNRTIYTTPEAELLEVKFEENIMSFDNDENNETFIEDEEVGV